MYLVVVSCFCFELVRLVAVVDVRVVMSVSVFWVATVLVLVILITYQVHVKCLVVAV